MSADLLTKPSGGVPLSAKGQILTYSTAPVGISVGANNTYFTADPAQTTGNKWAALASSAPNLGYTAVTSNITLDSNNDLVSASGSGGTFTITLPTASGITGKTFYLQRSDNTPSKLVKIATTSSQTIDGVQPVYLATQYEQWVVFSDGSNWNVRSHKTMGPWAAESGLTFSAAFGTVSGSNIFSRRVGDTYEVMGEITAGTSTSGTASIALPSGLVIDSAKLSANHSTILGQHNGTNSAASNINTGNKLAYVFYDGSDTANLYFAQASGSSVLTKGTGNGILITSNVFTFFFSVPIANWGA
jgi:hypothetical protein